MEYRTVQMADILPSEVNPREDFGDLEALAGSFDYGPYPGEPVQPITVVEDGGRYRIYDGERRYRAMKLRGTQECHANVCADFDEADMLTIAMVTDDKKQLTEAEKDRGVQRMLLLGVDPVAVDRAARVEGSQRAKRGYGMVGDAALLTFEQAKALEDFEGDDEAVAELVALAGKKAFDKKAKELGFRRTVLDARAAFEQALGKVRLELVDRCPEGSVPCGTVTVAEDLEAGYLAASAEHVGITAMFHEGRWCEWWAENPRISLFGKPMASGAEAEEDAAERARLEYVDRLLEAWPDETNAHDLWFDGKLDDAGADPAAFAKENPELSALVQEGWLRTADDLLGVFCDATDREFGQKPGGMAADMGPADWVVGWVEAKPRSIGEYTMGKIAGGKCSDWERRAAGTYVAWMDALKASGYKPSPAEEELFKACADAAEEAGDGE